MPCLNKECVRVLTVFTFNFLSNPMLSPAAPSNVNNTMHIDEMKNSRSRLSGVLICVASKPNPKR